MTTINYVRDLAGGGVVAAHGYRSQAPPTGTAARSSRPLGALRTDSAWCAGALGRLAPASA